MPEPTWSRIGTTTVKDTAVIETNDGSTEKCGEIDLFVEIYEVENDSRDGENYIACTPRAGIYPGCQLYGAEGTVNSKTVLTQRWDQNSTGGHEITDWGPTTSKTSEIDWSMSASYSAGGASGGVSASYDVKSIERYIESTPNETVKHRYEYPEQYIWNDTSIDEFVEVESLGEGWIDDAGYYDTMLGVDLDQKFRGSDIIGTYEYNYWVDSSASTPISKYRL